MSSIIETINAVNWEAATAGMHDRGYAVIPDFLDNATCDLLKAGYDRSESYRKTVVMERHGYGKGEYKYFSYPLPEIIQEMRTNIYPGLAPIANAWMKALGKDQRFPGTHDELLALCVANNQLKPTALILKYGPSGYNALHQDLYGEVYFPIQAVFFLSEAGEDFTGGEFVLTEQTPRAQSRAIVLTPKKGDMLIFTTNYRPAKGKIGYRRINMRHGVSEITSGERYTMGIIFHDAT